MAPRQDPPPPRLFPWKKWLISAIAILAVVFMGLAVILSWVLPSYLQSRLLPQTAQKFGLSAEHIQIRRIGLTGADLGPLVLKKEGQPELRIAGLRIDYTPRSLWQGRIAGLTIDGLHLAASFDQNGLAIAGITLPTASASAPSSSEPVRLPDLAALLPIALARIHIQNTFIELTYNGIPVQIPLEVELTTARMSQGRLDARLHLWPRGNTMELELTIDQPSNQARLALKRSRVLLESLADLLAPFTPLTIGGTAEAQGFVTAQLAPLAIQEAELSADLTRTRIIASPWQLQNTVSGQSPADPIHIRATLQGQTELAWSCQPFQIVRTASPVAMTLEQLSGQLTRTDKGWNLAATGQLTMPSQPLPVYPAVALTLQKPLAYTIDLTARQGSVKDMDFTLGILPRVAKSQLNLDLAGLALAGQSPRLQVQGQLAPHQLSATLDLALDGWTLPLPAGQFKCPSAKITGQAAARWGNDASWLQAHVAAEMNDIAARTGSTRAALPRVLLAADLSQKAGPMTVKADLRLADGRLEDTAQQLTLEGLELHLPLQWPFPKQVTDGRLDIRAALYQGRPLGDVQGRLFQQESGLVLEARHHSKLFKGLVVTSQVKADLTGAVVDFQIPAFDLPADLDLGTLIPKAAGFAANGTLQAEGRLRVAPGSVEGTASARLRDGRVRHTELDLDLAAIQADLAFADAIHLRSGPGQRLRIGSLRMGDITATDLQVDFQLEPEHTVLIEKAKMNWCRGVINTNAVRIRPGKDDYDFTLICDRLNLAMVLQQLGAAQGSGEGAVNGVIPVRWTQGQLHFDKGFLYSTPGQPGTIALHGTDFLLAGLPAGSPQHTQLDIATEALKDYTYNWAKLSLESDQDILLIKLQLDGKPNRLLPFGYDQNLGTLVRIQGKGEAEFKGINIDLNFKSPINEILNYKELLKNK